MKKIKSYDKFIKSNFNPKPSKKTYGWMPDPKMKVTKVKEEIDFKKGLIGAGLATSLLGTPAISQTLKQETPVTQTINKMETDGMEVYKNQIGEISDIRKRKSKDEKLSSILEEIQDNVNSKDTAKFIELYGKLSSHIEENYGFRIEKKETELQKASVGGTENLLEMVKGLSIFEICGWLGSICLAICGIPQAWQSYKDKHSDGISWGFLLLWAFGEIFALAYVYDKLDLPLLLNYATNIFILAVILYYKVKPQNKREL
jgi:uncharacterized protein with PQ loop repeat